MRFHHIAIIVSSEAGIDFYKDLGFEEVERQHRETDQIVWLEGNCCTLELFLDSTHPKRVTSPEANGLRHIAFETEHLEKMREKLIKYNPEEIKEKYRIFFVKDPARSIKGTTKMAKKAVPIIEVAPARSIKGTTKLTQKLPLS